MRARAIPAVPRSPWAKWANIYITLCPAIMLAYPMLVYPMMTSAFSAATGVSTAAANVEASESNIINVLYFLGFGGLAVLTAMPRLAYTNKISWSLATGAIVLYLALALCSVTWALAPAISFRRLVQQGLIVFTALFAGIAEPDPRKIVRRLADLMMIVVAINVAWLGVKPPSPIGVEAIYAQKNVLGGAMLVCLPILIFEALASKARRRLVCIVCAAGALFLLVISQSKTSLGIGFLVPAITFSVVLMGRILRMSPSWPFFFLMAVLTALSLLIGEIMGLTMDTVSLFLFNDTTFTGRTAIWDFVLSQAQLRPTFGYGFNSFWAIGTDTPSLRSAPGFIVSLLQAHNGYIDVRAETGYIGLIILFMIIITSIMQACRQGLFKDPALMWLALTLILTVAMHNGLESSFFRGFSLMWMSFLIAIGLTAPRFSTKRSAQMAARSRSGISLSSDPAGWRKAHSFGSHIQ